MAAFFLWSGTLWILSELSKLFSPPPDGNILLTYNEFRMTLGVGFVVMGLYILFKNIIFRDTILF